MATPALTGAALAQNRHQGGLREYMNQKLAPYLKKALKDVCDVEAEYPLQWLGEHLINQSFMYENNPDATGIKERFFYNFDPEPSGDDTAATATAAGESIPAASVTITSTIDPQRPAAETASPIPQQQLHNGEPDAVDGLMAETDETYDVSEQMDLGPGHGEAHTDMLNGVAEAGQDEVAAGHDDGLGQADLDTEMAGAT